jgi:hypothetical protein
MMDIVEVSRRVARKSMSIVYKKNKEEKIRKQLAVFIFSVGGVLVVTAS